MSSEFMKDSSAGDAVISVSSLGKYYEIYADPKDRLKQFVLPALDRALGGEPKKYYREFWALRDVSFQVRRGETVGIIGRNGSGKSTLLQLVCGTLTPSTGQVRTQGRVAALLELGSGFNPEFTGRENIMLSGALFGLTVAQMEERYERIVAFSGIPEFIDQPVKTYSSGMVVRLAFSVIAHVDADILVVDEALSVGDAYFTQKCMRFLRSFMKRGTLLFCSHDMGAIINLCERAIWLDKGALRMSGSPKDLSQAYLASLFEPDAGVEGQVDEIYEAESAKSGDGVKLEKVDNFLPALPVDYVDMRQGMIDRSHLRNDIEIFQFDEDRASFGTGAASITSVHLLDSSGRALNWAIGGQQVALRIAVLAAAEIHRPIVGFVVKDKLGQIIFADNTYISHRDKSITIAKGTTFSATFYFTFPVLPGGEYSISPAVAEGTQADHVQHQWIHDALILHVQSSAVCLGLFGVPMRKIDLEVMS
ncbi:Vitamin B12 import ATP-binding protein BtuD [Xanthomonas sacchari]|uniref:ABC transporter ATP-binding protein n=1 Tax=Xanthomonas sacchari TaxID=56458 RepID=A0AA46SVW6_9XANT|nr:MULTISPECIES: ABC transporter ATP-binding protein [Xanthomonas]KAB7780332.1 ABC transporter ATP-binding protein [Xanthomonas sp. LMG 12460]MCW0365025.1 Vitamin B12 import ATP-binding protein BtuD [Xanthomonas sacchari]MCW0439090.1 Vitamin B12 import ATP-binding protein BtuD [Xanthomonas sacchari]UYK89453.1 ABC transporter ATP-binding protein [Xanthomonas sacchari]